jgi:hypothetical protein
MKRVCVCVCFVRESSLRRADHSSRGVLPMKRVCVCVFCQGEFSATGRSLVQRSSTDEACMCVCVCVLSGRVLCDGSITVAEEFYR